MRSRPKLSARHTTLYHTIAVIVPAAAVILTITGFVSAHKPVTVVADGRTIQLRTQARDVASALAEAGVPVDADAIVTPSLDTVLEPQTTVVVRHPIRVRLDLGGEAMPLEVVGETVGDALIAAGADPAANSAVTPPVGTPLTAGMTISVPDAFVRIVRKKIALKPDVRTREDSSLSKGAERVVTAGSEGEALQIFRVLVTGGIEGAPVLTAEKVLEAPDPRIVAVGTAEIAPASPTPAAFTTASVPVTGAAPRSGREIRVLATGYSAQQPELSDRTATGARARRGVIAVDPDFIPLGTRVYVPGYGPAVAADTGGAIDGYRIDLCFDTVEEAIRWGTRRVTIVILD